MQSEGLILTEGTVFHPVVYYTGSGYGIISDDRKATGTAFYSSNGTSWYDDASNTWMIRVIVDDDVETGVKSISLGELKATFR